LETPALEGTAPAKRGLPKVAPEQNVLPVPGRDKRMSSSSSLVDCTEVSPWLVHEGFNLKNFGATFWNLGGDGIDSVAPPLATRLLPTN